jgi:glycosyltransferase involved in cell wall biosynthesis
MISENYNPEFAFYIYHENKDKLFIDIIDRNDNFSLVQSAIDSKFKIKCKNVLYKIIYFLTLKNINLKKANSFDLLLDKYDIEFIPKADNVKLITTMHDVQELYFPEFFTPEERAYRAVNYFDFAKRADAVIVSYNHVKDDLKKFFNINELKINTLLIGIQYLWLNDFKSTDNLRTETNLSYLLYPANSWHHKNHIAILEGLYILKAQNKIINIVFTGDFNTENGLFLVKKIKELDLENQIVIKGIVDQNELFDLYLNALGVVVPTLYEAGSYPLYEAIYLEKAVICSNVTSLPETIGDEKFVFSPKDYIDIAKKMEMIYFDEVFRKESAINSIKMKEKLKNNEFISSLYKLYNSI